MNEILVYTHASELLTGVGVRLKDGRHPKEEDLGIVEDGAVVVNNKKILWAGKTVDLPKKYLKSKRKNLAQKSLITPGFVDCHTHLIFDGSRANEFAMRCGGASYKDVAKMGGGIVSTVRATRDSSETILLAKAKLRVKEMIRHGVRTIEIKSGYGLDLETELKTLRIAQKLKSEFKELNFQITFLGAHAVPKDKTKEEYVNEIIREFLPVIDSKKLADACDVFVDDGYFTVDDSIKIYKKAKSLGMKIKMHADELCNTEATTTAVKMNALSADHLLKISDKGIKTISKSHTVAVLLPITALYLKAPYAPARKLIDSGAAVALATDFNPGSAMCASLPIAMTLGALYMGMTKAEIFSAVTYNGAKALGFEKEMGSIEPGLQNIMTILPFTKFEEIYYQLGW